MDQFPPKGKVETSGKSSTVCAIQTEQTDQSFFGMAEALIAVKARPLDIRLRQIPIWSQAQLFGWEHQSAQGSPVHIWQIIRHWIKNILPHFPIPKPFSPPTGRENGPLSHIPFHTSVKFRIVPFMSENMFLCKTPSWSDYKAAQSNWECANREQKYATIEQRRLSVRSQRLVIYPGEESRTSVGKGHWHESLGCLWTPKSGVNSSQAIRNAPSALRYWPWGI